MAKPKVAQLTGRENVIVHGRGRCGPRGMHLKPECSPCSSSQFGSFFLVGDRAELIELHDDPIKHGAAFDRGGSGLRSRRLSDESHLAGLDGEP